MENKTVALPAGARFAKLPIWKTVKASYQLTWNYRAEYFRIARLWLIVALPVLFIYHWLIWSYQGESDCAIKATLASSPMHEAAVAGVGLLTLTLQGLFIVFIISSIAVAWHRLILLDETPTSDRYLRKDKTVGNYYKFGLFLSVLPFAAILVPGAFFFFEPDNILLWTVKITIAVILLGFVGVFTVQASIALPAKALELYDITAMDAYRRTKGNFWRISFGTGLCTLPALPFSFLLQPICNGKLLDVMIYSLADIIDIITITPLTLTFLSLAFHHFYRDRVPV